MEIRAEGGGGVAGMRNWMEAGRPAGVAGVWLVLLFAAAGCSRSGALSGDVVVRTAAGERMRGARIGVQIVTSTDTFEREWADAIALFRQEVAPAAAAQKAAEQRAEQARLAWTRALTARGKDRARGGQWTLSLRDTNAAGSQELWRGVRATEGLVFQARKRVEEIVRTHDAQAVTLLDKHATQRVQTDETGRYVLVKIPSGKAYLAARFRADKAQFVWFIPVQVQGGAQQLDLTEQNQGGWPFTP
jgi:hypothetical protein